MFHHIDYVPSGSTGAPLSGVTVRAYLSADGSLADIFADESGTPFSPANEVKTDGTGMYDFWVADDIYDLRFYIGSALVRTVPKLQLGSNVGISADLASADPDKGGALVATARASLLTAAAYRTLSSKAEDRFDFRDMDGCDLTGANDMASTFRAACLESASSGDVLHLPGGPSPTGAIITLGSTVDVPANVRIKGAGNQSYYSGLSGSWLQFGHLGVGLNIVDPTFPIGGDGMVFEGFGTRRIQPTPAPGFTPIAADFDIVNNAFDLLMRDFMFLNPTKAFRQTSGGLGRTTWENVRGQPFSVGAQIDEAYDGFIASNTRWWPFWSNDLYTRAFTLANRRGLQFGRCDNPSVQFWFDIFSKYPVYLANNAAGALNNANFYGFEADNYGSSFLYSESGQTGGHATFIGGYSFGDSASGHAVELTGANTVVRLEGMRNHGCEKSVVKISGAGNLVQVTSAKIQWNILNGGHVAYDPGAGTSRIRIDGDIVSEGGSGAVVVTDGVRVSSSTRLSSALTIAPSSGSITTANALIAYRRQGDRVTYDLTVEIVANGTGSGAGIALFGVPVAALTGSVFTNTGSDQGSGSKAVTATVSGTNIFLRNYDGTYPGYSGASFTISGSYEANPL